MAAYKALVSFSGAITMRAGEVREITEPAIVADLINAGYIEGVEQERPTKRKPTRKRTAKE